MVRRPLYVAFVGMKRAPSDLPEGYIESFIRYHLELPYYYAKYTDCRVHLTLTEPAPFSKDFREEGGGTISTLTEGQFLDPTFKETHNPYDLVIHWRKWNDDLYVPGARNVVVLQDHSYSTEWKSAVSAAFKSGKLDGLMLFPNWHLENTIRELDGIVPSDRLYTGLSLAVDTDIYKPGQKDPFQLLWASDPGRGLYALIEPFMKLWQKDRRFRLNVVYPDYVQPAALAQYAGFFRHPGVKVLGCVPNGQGLWDLFNNTGILPYTSTFKEPFGRCPMQAMSAGSLVLYPPGMGTPAALIEEGNAGILAPIDKWHEIIPALVSSGEWAEIGKRAREFALTKDWRPVAQKFYNFFSKDLS